VSVIFPLPLQPQIPRPFVRNFIAGVFFDPDIIGRFAGGPKALRGGFFSIFRDRGLDHRLRLLRADANTAPSNGQHNCPISADHDRFVRAAQAAGRRALKIFATSA
jgi:hypothetical protein